MTRFAYVRSGVVVNLFDTVQPASAFPDIAAFLVVADVTVQPGWFWDGVAFAARSLPVSRQALQDRLDAFFDLRASVASMVRNGTVTTVTAAQVGSFLAAGANNYRSLRASIAAAVDLAGLDAIDITAGWPANP